MKKQGIVSALCAMALCFGLAIYGISQVEAAETNTAAQKSVLLNLTQPIEAQKSSMASAKFAELTPEAMKFGMGEATINGSVEFKMLEDRTVRSSIRWDSISIENAGKKVTEGLETSLNSRFRMQQEKPRAEPGTKIKAFGDLEALATALGKLKARLDEKDVVQKETTNNKTQAQVSPVVSNAQDANNGKYLSDVGTPFNTVVESGTSTSYELCSDRFIDLGSMKAFKQYKPVYTKNGVQTGEGVCAPNASEFTPIQQKDGVCTYRFDMANGTAIKQTQYFYTDNGTDVLVGGCRDATTTYPLYESRTGCPVTTDTANMKVFPQSRLVFKLGNTEQNATECRAVSGSTGIPLVEEACDPMFENDFVNNVSYLLTRLFYNSDVDGSKVYVSSCGRSSSVSFSHINDTANCGWEMDDSKLLGRQKATTIIDTGGIAGIVTIRGCQVINTVNYSFLGLDTVTKKFQSNATYEFPAGAQTITALLVGAGAHGNYGCMSGSSGNNRSAWAGGGGVAGQYKTISMAQPTAGDTVSITFDQATKNTLTYKGAVFEVDAGQGQLPSGTSSGTTTNDNEAGIAKAAASTGQPGYAILGSFGINSSSDYPKPSDAVYGYGHGGFGWYTFSGYGLYGTTVGCQPQFGMGNVVYPDPGVVIFDFKIPKYMRPDGTNYTPGQ